MDYRTERAIERRDFLKTMITCGPPYLRADRQEQLAAVLAWLAENAQ